MIRLPFTPLVAAAIFAAGAATAADPPNIVLLLSDDQAWTDYGFMGHDAIKTPALDKLAAGGATFRRGYVPTALCRPSLMCLATGHYASRHGVTGNDPSPKLAPPRSPDYQALRDKLIAKIEAFDTLPELLAAQGYVSFQSGKWWEGSAAHGGFTAGMTHGDAKRGGRHGDVGLKIGREGMEPVLGFIDKAVADQKPFYLWYAPFLPHTPHTPPQRLLDKYTAPDRPEALAKYYAMCEWYDETCAAILDHLDAKGIAENTLVVSLTDNGWIQRTPQTGVPEGWTQAFAPRSKQSPNEGGTRTPIIYRWPARIKAGERPELATSLDIFPTMLAAAGAPIPEGLPGLNLLPQLASGEAIARDTIFGESFAHDIADLDNPQASLLYRWVIEGKWKLLLTYDGEVGRYGNTHPRTEKRPQLFDLIADPTEEKNLAAENPDVVARLAKKLEDWYPTPQRKVVTEWGAN
ncbi:MAG: sulfatase [Verrucomicrobiales bacterium]